ncbi:MAG: hypothetical protein GFH27_549285n257 [Chloroflexi bacterium AL-W]|nr:hypothetical protein [Chloroflexi bacterium AL-N1]NOK65769.1 hypothetical protein [Chloroflexi bacterium AL-N10]NOK74290.1 hypothetical protein [Chloroflexi bacterium AL-N5]NOK80802.1 hypothetical protein [Chloroflexi bacterium AL-W]NOK88548.1 hypothetical protein [Chloroflexi bacterium AL-N15]
MAESQPQHTPKEPHPWADLPSDKVLDILAYELYGPISVIGNEVDRLSNGTFEDEELPELIEQLQESINQLSKIVVTLKRYTKADPDLTTNIIPPATPKDT